MLTTSSHYVYTPHRHLHDLDLTPQPDAPAQGIVYSVVLGSVIYGAALLGWWVLL